ncbi:MAG TPA: protein kinase, partial [Pyrinomonadaceae bacterium]|nr:protein kinase [Pyrinomonadaceae bacterium]
EARAASALNHPNIIVIYEIFEADETLMMATEFVDGVTLRQRLTSSALNLKEVLSISIQVADALAAAHKAGIIHRDIKPENIMLRPDGYVKVLDFGLAKLSEPGAAKSFAESSPGPIKTGSGVVIGTVGYMSPEQARGQNVDARSDIFNFGAVMYEMVAGQKPFRGETPSDTFAAILKTEPPSLLRIAPNTPAELVRIVTKALRKDREERYQSVKDLLLDLKSLKEELDFQTKLDRSTTPTSSEAVAAQTFRTSTESRSETDEIKIAVSTITHSLGVQFKRHKAGVILASAVLALLIVGGSIGLYKLLTRNRTQPVAGPKILKTTQVTFSPGLDGFPSLSPDGNSVAYSSDQNGNFEIYIKQLSPGGGELQLTNDGQQNIHPSWSPDGQRIAYHSKKHGGIWVVSALGGAPRQLTETGVRPAWSPDGSFIAFQSAVSGVVFGSRTMPPSIILIVPAQGGTPRPVTQPGNPSGGHSSPSWSPDSKRIAFEVSDYLSIAVWSIAADGSDPKKMIGGSQPVYSGDGRYMYFLTGEKAEAELARMPLSATGDPIGQPVTVLQAGGGSVFSEFAISRDGVRVLYRVDRTVSNLRTISLSPTGDPSGPSAIFASDTSSRNSLPRFSPDGRKIVLNRWRTSMSVDLWVADADGKNLTQLTNNPGVDSQASWLPGDDRLVFLTERDARHLRLWTVSLTTGKQEFLMDLGEGIQFAALSPDGKQVAYNFVTNGIMNVWLAKLENGERRQLTFDTEMAGFPCWSPDGRLIAYEVKRGEDDQLMVIPSNGGQPVQLTNDKGRSWPHSFSPDGDKVAFAGQRDGVWNIYSIDMNTRTQKQLTDYTKLSAFVRYPAWATNQIVYEYAETTANLWMLELAR